MPFLRLANGTGLLLSPTGAKTVVIPDTSFPAAADGRLWLNLDFAADWTPDNFLIDAMRQSRMWRAGTASSQNDLTLLADMMATADADNYPTELPAGVLLCGTVILTEQATDAAPSLAGRYRLEWQGTGTVVVAGGTSQTSGTGWIEFDYTPTGSNLVEVQITALPNPADNIRAMHCYNLDHAALRAAGQVVNPAFKAAWPNISLIRPMQSFETNTNTNGDWAFAPTPTSIGRGACNEDMIAAANEMGCNLWINIPSRADSNYVTQVATLVRDNLNPALKCYFEYANEWWNWAGGFETYPYLEALRASKPYDFTEMAGGRSCETMVAVSTVFSGQMHRVVRVAGMHTGWLGLEDGFLNAPGWVAEVGGRVAPHTVHDAIAVTGYFNCDTDEWEGILTAATANYATGLALLIEKTLEHIEALRTSNFPHFRDVADTYGMDMIMYEGGSHLLNPGGLSNSALCDTLLADLNTGADLYDVYDAMFQAWHQFSAFSFNQFVGISDSAFGCMAHLNDTSQGRYQAVLDYNDGTLTAVTPLPLNQRLIVTGHSIPDAINGPLDDAITAMGGTPATFFGTGPFAGAQYRWENDPAGPLQVRSLLEAGGASYDAFIGIEASDYYLGSSRSTVQQFISFGNAFQFALEWHNAAAATGAQTYYGNFCRNDTAELFDASWRAAQDAEVLLWDSIIDDVNANKDVGTPDMLLVPWAQALMAVWDGIDSGAVTGTTMAAIFVDDIHPSSAIGRWIQIATTMAVVYHRHPDELPANAGTDANIDSGLAAQLRPIIWNVCRTTARTGLT